jgi:hypothetical protein
MDEIRCPFCNALLDTFWVRRQGASLLGKAGGAAKRRFNAKQAAEARWAKARERAGKESAGQTASHS